MNRNGDNNLLTNILKMHGKMLINESQAKYSPQFKIIRVS